MVVMLAVGRFLLEGFFKMTELTKKQNLIEEYMKEDFEKFNAAKLTKHLSNKEWERVLNHLIGKSIFESAKILRDKYLQKNPGQGNI